MEFAIKKKKGFHYGGERFRGVLALGKSQKGGGEKLWTKKRFGPLTLKGKRKRGPKRESQGTKMGSPLRKRKKKKKKNLKKKGEGGKTGIHFRVPC